VPRTTGLSALTSLRRKGSENSFPVWRQARKSLLAANREPERQRWPGYVPFQPQEPEDLISDASD
jgi:hypothetical protein